MLKVPNASLVLTIALVVVAGFSGCTDRKEDDPDRRPGPAQDTVSTNVKEGSATGRGVSPATGVEATLDRPLVTNIQEILSASNPAVLETRQVQLSGIAVQRVLSSQYVLVGIGKDQSVPVRLKELQPTLKEGQLLNIGGMISQLGEDLAHWELDPENKKLVSQFKVFINAF